ncbi:MAG: cytochrome c1 [Woeseiaceae bacterium]|jgi:ubiquinol-cytochrome c reductase cytochrome c1 subunit|nr:cytochrome c1 [Woeseiaceae bacterium]
MGNSLKWTVSALPKLTAGLCTLLLTCSVFAASTIELDPTENDPDNINSLQRGARNFMNYCSGCHSAKYVRFNTLGKGLQLSEDQLLENLMFNAEKTFETIQASMPMDAAARWFGQPPPDMSLMARARGTDYVFNFMRGFYLDPDSPTGVDNRVLEGTGMPNVLWELQGYQSAVFSTDENGTQHFDKFEQVTEGTMSAEEFDEFARDTANFLEHISEPVRSTRRVLGVWVLMFLIVFWVIASMLKKQVWKDVT